MGKRDTRIAWVNPIAAARASGPVEHSGPTMRDYLNRDRPTVDDVKSFLKEKHGSRSLANWEEEQDRRYRDELKKQREAVFAGQDQSGPSKKKPKKSKKEKKKKRKRSRPPSLSPTHSSSSEQEKATKTHSYETLEKVKRIKGKRKRRRSVSPQRAGSSEVLYETKKKKGVKHHLPDSNELSESA